MLIYSIAQPAETKEIVAFLTSHFIFDEPINRTVGLQKSAEMVQCLDHLTANCIRDGVSVVARDGANSNRIVGSRCSYIESLSGKENAFDFQVDDVPLDRVKQFLCTLEERLEDLLTGCKKLLRFENLSVHPNYRRRGVAKRLCEMSLEAGKEAGCDAAVTMATNHASQGLFESLNFKTLKSIVYSEYSEKDGGKIVPIGEKEAKLMVLQL